MATLRTEDLTKSYGGRTVVRGVNLDVASGEIVGLLGPNGAGKTTTFYMTVGLTQPDSGRAANAVARTARGAEPHAARAGAGSHALGRRAPSRRDHPRARRLAEIHPA